MIFSSKALLLIAARRSGLFKTRARFWEQTEQSDIFASLEQDEFVLEMANKIEPEICGADFATGVVSYADEDFPCIPVAVKNKGERPYLFLYRGNISLLERPNNNVAVIGVTNPSDRIIQREQEIVRNLVNHGVVIVSGLATGCDTVAHDACLAAGGKTIAWLPSTLQKIFPKENQDLADRIVAGGGLLITEYSQEAESRSEAINRFIERDRLQAMFSKSVILIASYRQKEGDSGSRHAMEAAKKYGIARYVMFNSLLDANDPQFGLNQDILTKSNQITTKITDQQSPVQILPGNYAEEITKLQVKEQGKQDNLPRGEQMTLF